MIILSIHAHAKLWLGTDLLPSLEILLGSFKLVLMNRFMFTMTEAKTDIRDYLTGFLS